VTLRVHEELERLVRLEAFVIGIVIDPFPPDAALRDLWRSAWSSEGPQSFQPILKRSLVHVGAFAESQLVGFVNVAWDGGIHAFLLDTCVHASVQRQGLGSKLVSGAVEHARARGAQWLHVDYEPHLAQFYERCGFRPTQAGLMAL
jgi:GNAT superfamily N-acetyltransferase